MKNYTVNKEAKGKAIALSNAKRFAYNTKLIDIVGDVIDRTREAIIDSDEDYREALNISAYIDEAVEATLIYDEDKWEMMKVYCTPEEASYMNAVELFGDDIKEIIDNRIVLDLAGYITVGQTGPDAYDVILTPIGKEIKNFHWVGSLESLQFEYWDYEIEEIL